MCENYESRPSFSSVLTYKTFLLTLQKMLYNYTFAGSFIGQDKNNTTGILLYNIRQQRIETQKIGNYPKLPLFHHNYNKVNKTTSSNSITNSFCTFKENKMPNFQKDNLKIKAQKYKSQVKEIIFMIISSPQSYYICTSMECWRYVRGVFLLTHLQTFYVVVSEKRNFLESFRFFHKFCTSPDVE